MKRHFQYFPNLPAVHYENIALLDELLISRPLGFEICFTLRNKYNVVQNMHTQIA
jgi:hypothetical protein